MPLRRWTDVGESKVQWRDFMRAGAEMAAIYRAYGIKRDFNTLLRVTTTPFLRYVGAGGVGTLCHYMLLALLVSGFGVGPSLASVAGAILGASVNYLLNYHFTFACDMAHRVTVPRFALVAAMSVALNGVGMWLATSKLGLHYFIAQLGCTGLVLAIGYLINAAWTFRSHRAAPRPSLSRWQETGRSVSPQQHPGQR
jgi:putative flippase GtrA